MKSNKIKIFSALTALMVTASPVLVKGETNYDKVNTIVKNEISQLDNFEENYNIDSIRIDNDNILHATLNYENNDKEIYIKYNENCNHNIKLVKEFHDAFMYKCDNCETTVIIKKINHINLSDEEKYNIANNIIEKVVKPLNNTQYKIQTIIYSGTTLNIILLDKNNKETSVKYNINKFHDFKLEHENNEYNLYKCSDCENTILIKK